MRTRVIFLGAPGSGKGTQADKLSKTANIPHIDTGGMLREEIAAQTEEGKIAKQYLDEGKLAPASLVIQIIKNRLSRPDVKNGFILDGFPRSLEQAEGLDKILKEINEQIDQVFNIDLDESVLIDRMAYRKSCKCGQKYNMKFNPPKNDNLCDVCEEQLTQRDDDNVETATKRINTYKTETEPLINYYKEKELVNDINGNRGIDEIFDEITGILGIKTSSI